jgi:hypothetical protein
MLSWIYIAKYLNATGHIARLEWLHDAFQFVALMKPKRNQGFGLIALDFISLHRGYAS